MPAVFGSSQVRGQIGTAAASLHHSYSNTGSENHSHSNAGSKLHLWPTPTTAHGNPGSLTHWARPGIEPASLRIPVRFVTTEPQWELLNLWVFFCFCCCCCCCFVVCCVFFFLSNYLETSGILEIFAEVIIISFKEIVYIIYTLLYIHWKSIWSPIFSEKVSVGCNWWNKMRHDPYSHSLTVQY